ncbi:MAG TPA: ribonuclease P protein component [Thermomicrobiales bacterium]
MERRLRLRAEADFAHVRSQGRSWRDRLFTLIILPNDQPHNRYGFVVSKRVGNAVTRNLVKRRLREILRDLDSTGRVHAGYDCLLIVRPVVAEVPFAALSGSVEALLGRAKLLQSALHTTGVPPEIS